MYIFTQNIYQFRLLLKGISPIIWRRLLVNGNSSIADFHHIIQMAMGWSNTYLHQFIIRGKSYGISYAGGMSFCDDPHQVRLCDFQFDPNERFIYEYSFFANWQIEIRLEKELTAVPNKLYPFCVAGARTSPPEECKGAVAFMELGDYYSDWRIEEILYHSAKQLKSKEITLPEFEEIINELNYWVNRHKFDRHGVNHLLKKFATHDPEWEDYMAEVIML